MRLCMYMCMYRMNYLHILFWLFVSSCSTVSMRFNTNSETNTNCPR